MIEVEETVDIDREPAAVYERWARFESFPEFMEGIKEVRRLDEDHFHWVAEIAGRQKEWDAEATQRISGKAIAWESTGGAPVAGTVVFDALERGRTRVTLQLRYEPADWTEQVSEVLGIVQARVRSDLDRFRALMEGDEPGEARRDRLAS